VRNLASFRRCTTGKSTRNRSVAATATATPVRFFRPVSDLVGALGICALD